VSLCARKGPIEKYYFKPEIALKRIEKMGDLFEPVLQMKQTLPKKFQEALAGQPVAKRKRVPKTGDLKEYKSKRDFSKTAEPPPKLEKTSGKNLQYVIQKHAASHLHYDFRLELEGTLKSWAVPKGVPYTKGEKRLAMHVEDHPMEYATFEGTIPKGQYGGGTVMVWDFGTYEVMDGNYYSGKLHMRLKGKKLKGEWILVRIGRKEDDKKAWLLIKAGESMKPLTASQDDASAATRRSMARITKDNDAEWKSNRG
jgi:bifunctional non-homologous end joining protein LigD